MLADLHNVLMDAFSCYLTVAQCSEYMCSLIFEFGGCYSEEALTSL